MSRPSPILPAHDVQAQQHAAEAMAAGGVVAFPTDTVYGLGTALDSLSGIAAIFALKGRSSEKALPVLLGDASQLERVAAHVPPAAELLIARFWPGALTLVLQRHPRVSPEIAPGRATLGIRIPDHPLTLALLRALATPMASSSANCSGANPALTARQVAAAFPTGLAAILDGGPAPGGVASTVVDLSQPGRPVLLRHGAISLEALQDTLGLPIKVSVPAP